MRAGLPARKKAGASRPFYLPVLQATYGQRLPNLSAHREK